MLWYLLLWDFGTVPTLRKTYNIKSLSRKSCENVCYIHTYIYYTNYNIKYICTIYTRLNTCLMSISRLSLRDKVTLRLLKLYFYITDVVESSRVLDIKLSDLCCSVSMVWVQIPSREEQHFSAQRSNSNTVWFNLYPLTESTDTCSMLDKDINKWPQFIQWKIPMG